MLACGYLSCSQKKPGLRGAGLPCIDPGETGLVPCGPKGQNKCCVTRVCWEWGGGLVTKRHISAQQEKYFPSWNYPVERTSLRP